jgi:hypothetical protein
LIAGSHRLVSHAERSLNERLVFGRCGFDAQRRKASGRSQQHRASGQRYHW